MLTVDEHVQLTCGSPGHGGIVVARHDGQAVFVRGALPGEVVRARVTEVKKSYARAVVVEVVEPSEHRVPEACAAAANGAGCCDLTIATPEFQRQWKTDVLADLLVRVGRFDPGSLTPQVASMTADLNTGWRHRARLHVDDDGTLGWRAARSHAIVSAAGCAQLPTGFIDGLRGHPGDEVAVVLDDRRSRHAVGPKNTVLAGTGLADYRVGDHSWTIPAGTFWQAHRDAATRYSAVVARWTQQCLDAGSLRAGAAAWDLYGGAGVFAATLADRGFEVDVVESSRQAVESGRAALSGTGVRFHRGDVARALTRLRSPQLVVLDPPRAGAGKTVVAALAGAAPKRVIHVGCDPASFARDLALFRSAGFTIDEVAAYDAFPGTHHIECLALLRRDGSP